MKSIKKMIAAVLAVTIVLMNIPMSMLMAVESESIVGYSDENQGDEENPIESFICEDIEIIEGTKGFYTQGYDEETDSYQQYFYYHATPTFKITFKDGTVIDRPGQFEYNGETYYISYSANNQSYDNQWMVGNTYSGTASLFGISVEYDVTIVESPVESVVCEPMEIVENTNGYYCDAYDEVTGERIGEYFYYNMYPKYTITFKDGTVMKYQQGGTTYDDEWYSFEVQTKQSYQNRLIVGNQYNAIGSILGKQCEYTVNIVSCPIESIDCKDIQVIEGTHGQYVEEYEFETQSYRGYYHYVCSPIFDVAFSDGTKLLNQQDGFEYNGEYYFVNCSALQNYSNQWEAGKTYSVAAEVFGIKDSYNVTITESPVESIHIDDITIVEGTNLVEAQEWDYESESYVQYSKYDYSVQGGNVTMKDGTVYELSDSTFDYNGESYSLYITDDQSYSNKWDLGTHTATVKLMGVGTTIKVDIADPNTTKIIQQVDFETFSTRNVYMVGEEFELEGVSLRVTYTDGTSEVITDIADDFEVEGFPFEEEWFGFPRAIYKGHTFYSHWEVFVCKTNVFFPDIVTFPNKLVYEVGEELDLDGLSIIIYYVDGSSEIITEGFEITGFDSTTPGIRTVDVTCDELTEAEQWCSFEITVNEPGADEPEVIGDMDGDGVLTSDDAIYLLYHTMNTSDYPIEQNGDFDRNGYVTSDDAIYLLYHVMMQEKFPIQ